MILATRFGNREIRSGEFGSSAIPPPGSGWTSAAGISVTPEAVYGLPAVSAVLRSIADLVASLSMIVYRDAPAGRERAPDSWQYRLLHDEPAVGMSAFQFYFDLALSIEASGNAFVQKIRSSRRVEELYVLDPQRVACYVKNGETRYDYWRSPVERVTLTSADVLHIRGFTPTPAGLCGVSLMQLHRDPLGSALAVQKFEGHFFRHGARPGIVMEFPATVNRAQAQEWLDLWNSEHQGVDNAHKAGAVGQGGAVKSMPVSLEDALFVETKRLAIEDVARIFRWPRDLLELTDESNASDEQRSIRLLKFYLLPRLKRIERALAADSEMFGGSKLFPEFLTESLLRADMKTRNESYLKARQAGWMTANEIRERENMPAHPDGDELQSTPVGGAPNPSHGGGSGEPMEPGMESEMNEGRRSLPHESREDTMPEVHVHLPEIRMPEKVTAELRAPDVIVNLPEQRQPDVIVQVPELRQPDIIVNVPEQPAPIVNVAAPEVTVKPQITVQVEPPQARVIEFKRDRQGRITEASVEDAV